jgi:succinoglycan biosynthesis transport protein ExoP
MQQIERGERTDSTADVKQYIYLLWSWAWLIVLAGVLAGATAYFVSRRTTPIYQAVTRLLVSAPSSITGFDPTALVTTQNMTSTYQQMLLDRPVLQGVIDQLKLQTTPEQLKKSIVVDSVLNTQLLTITVNDTDPGRAADIANAMATEFASRIGELQSQRYAASRDGLAAQVKDMEQQIATTSSEIEKTYEPSTLQQLQARLTQYRTIYSSLVTSYEQVRLAEAQTSTNVVVSEPATPNTIPVQPKTTRNTVVAVLAGMLLAAGAVYAVETLDDTVKNPEEIRRKFGLPILGMIAWHETVQDRPIALAEPRSPEAEAFRALRTNIMYAAVDRPLRRILITSATPEDGKTTVASSLAVVLSQNEKTVVLVDADLRRPQVHRKFGLQNRIGLSDLFVRPLDSLSGVLQAITPRQLAVITSGGLPPNPAELLTSSTMRKLLDLLNQVFDVIVIDSPPLLTVTDAAALAPSMDGVILVAKPGITKLDALKQSVEQLRAVEARLMGIVLNEVKPSSRKYGYYYNRYYSEYSHYDKGGGRGRGGRPRAGGSKKRDKALQTEPEAGALQSVKAKNV